MNSNQRETDWAELSWQKCNKRLRSICTKLAADLPNRFQWHQLTDLRYHKPVEPAYAARPLDEFCAFAQSLGVKYRIAQDWPRPWWNDVRPLLGERLFLFASSCDRSEVANCNPHDTPLTKTQCIVSSYRGRLTTESPLWQQSLIRTIAKAKDEKATLLIGQTPIKDSVANAVQHLNVPICEFFVEQKPKSLQLWLADSIARSLSENDRKHMRLYISPESFSSVQTDTTKGGLPTVDLLSSLLPDRVTALELQPKSKTADCLRIRLRQAQSPPASVVVRVAPKSAAEKGGEVYRDLIAQGSVGLLQFEQPRETLRTRAPKTEKNAPIITQVDWIEKILQTDSAHLTHCTRARHGRWPDQTQGEYLDELLMGKSELCDTPLATLIRILTQQRLIATNWFQRSQQPAVCFSAVPLDQLLRRRTFRSHLARWDWEPFGICIRSTVARKLGAQPVRYLPSTEYESLPENQRGLFQLASDEKSKNQWQQEHEWRILHDVRLARLTVDDAFVFVKTLENARHISGISRFPIVPLETQSCYT